MARVRWRNLMGVREVGLLLVLLGLVLVLSVAAPGFLSWPNLSGVLVNVSVVAISAVGMTMVIITGGIDISVGSILAVSALLVGQAAKAGTGLWQTITLGLLIGGALGGINGLLVAYGRIPAIIVTLATMSTYRGINFILSHGAWVVGLPPYFTALGQTNFLGLQIPAWIMLGVAVIGWYILTQTRFGRSVYAVGGNMQGAYLAGIKIPRVQFLVFLVSGLLTGLAATVYTARFGLVQINTGMGYELNVIAAVVIGGTSIMGGSGSIQGAILGAIFMGVVSNALVLLRISAFWQGVVVGILILGAVIMDSSIRASMLRAVSIHSIGYRGAAEPTDGRER